MDSKTTELGTLLKERLQQRSLSLRELSTYTEIDKATLSRIMNGKRKPTLNHLQRLSDSLNLSLDQLLAAAGFPIKNEKVHSDTFIQAVEEIETTLKDQEVYDGTFSQTKLKQKLNEYETYSQTNEGKETISAKFEKKMETLNGIGPFLQHLKDMYSLFMTGRGTSRELMLMGGALLYFIMPVDLIPDYIFPIGYIDDAAAVKIVIDQLTNR
ncbi:MULTISPECIES: DUF1232 domain-containing protein [Bacillus]|uniref:DNA-binding protein n=1 Tax=Bacillus pumilus (strain SAFR-032) TaxID=315750 RepID=A8FGL8_BACP2|nr:DUF1232 domain-containing protein [Bacillus pumilus]ABV63385.1 DNA-binding protein [Bacillus pumilus SAFR-032]MBC3644551.1 DUF1232 domain-containing protein [Bacillus pumilus]MBC3648154.1 DUF1232 domain-containing protein [Bacillus pumilus]MBC3651838.1 DUF1232 domain-containing protein [Bacillus pumilus]MBC3655302.1 DUF1232 domain-containing protein [Bacillus pumilus]